MTGWQLFWILKLSDIQNLFIAVMVITPFGGLAHCFYIATETKKNVFYFVRRYTIAVAILLSSAILLPSTKQMFTILVLPKIINNEQIKELPSLAVKATKEWLLREITQNEAAKKLIEEVVKEDGE